MTDSVVVPVSAQLVSRGGRYDLQGLQVTFSANGVPTCVAILSVGRSDGTGAAVDVDFFRGDSARIVATCHVTASNAPNGFAALGEANYRNFNKGGTFQLFDGVIDDYGPATLTAGQFAIQVRMFGRLSLLASGTLQSSSIVPKSYMDTSVAFPLGGGRDDNALLIRTTEALADLWSAIIRPMRAITQASGGPSGGVAETITSLFGSDLNGVAYDVMGSIVGNLPLKGSMEGLLPGVVDRFNTYMMRDFLYESFFNRIVSFGEMLWFSVLETGLGIKVVPYQPFFTRTEATTLYPNTWSSFSQLPANYSNYAGAVLVDGNGSSSEKLGSGEDLVVGKFKLPNASLGQVHVGTVPDFFAGKSNAMDTGGEGVRATTGVLPSTLGDDLAKLLTLHFNYQSRKVRVASPGFRTDIGPLEAVKIAFPNIPEVVSATNDFAVYGSVQSVTISLDAGSGTAETVYDVGYVRSSQQQDEIDTVMGSGEHPFFTANAIGGRLDQFQDRARLVS